MKPEKWKLEAYAPHQHMDVQRRNDNIDAGRTLCDMCDGTGNELFSMYRKCEDCNGTGFKVVSDAQG